MHLRSPRRALAVAVATLLITPVVATASPRPEDSADPAARAQAELVDPDGAGGDPGPEALELDTAATPEPLSVAEQEEPDSGLWIVVLEDRSGSRMGPTAAQADLVGAVSHTLGRQVQAEHTYGHALDGAALEMSAAEAAQVEALPGVAFVEADVAWELETDVSHDIIHSTDVWGGDTAAGVGTTGEGVIVGVIDSGVNAAHPSFAATGEDGYVHSNPWDGYRGVCAGERRTEDICNDKLIGAYDFHNGSATAQDTDGHGSHVASTIAGNAHDATVTVGTEQVTRHVSGVAPHANW